MPGAKPYQSKLIPHLELIRELREKFTPYPEIARILRDEHHLEVAASTVFDFVKRRSKGRKGYAIALDLPIPNSPPAPDTQPVKLSPPPVQPPPPPTTKPATTQEPRHEKRRATVSAAKEAAAARSQAADKPARSAGWAAFKRDVDPTKPLNFIKPDSDQSNDTHAN